MERDVSDRKVNVQWHDFFLLKVISYLVKMFFVNPSIRFGGPRSRIFTLEETNVCVDLTYDDLGNI